MIKRPGQGFAINILLEADMSHLMENRMGNLHWILTPDKEHPDHSWIACFRMVKPWHEWLCIIFPSPKAEKKARDESEYVDRVREFIGDDSVDFKIKGISYWAINETAADEYSRGDVFALGDAVHRHPPNHGLGSNTCIQDAHNLAWKVAYVDKGETETLRFQRFPRCEEANLRLPSYRIRRKRTFKQLQRRTSTCRPGCRYTVSDMLCRTSHKPVEGLRTVCRG